MAKWHRPLAVCSTAFALILACPAASGQAQPETPAPAFTFDGLATPAQTDAIPLRTGPQAANMPAEDWFRMNGDLNVRNVSAATLTPFLPAPDKATGAAVIVAPGGGFFGLSIETEGYAVARWLAAHGIAAFVLKYRVLPTPADFDVFTREMLAVRSGKPSLLRLPEDTPAFSREDGLAALALVRTRAREWQVDPSRIGMMGFSAGAFTTLSVTATARPGERPAFIAPIYGRMSTRDVPADAPPMFAVLAEDDPLFAAQGFGLVESWVRARRPVEFHLYQNGGHGFGLGRPGTTSDGWINAFMTWLRANHLLGAA